ncbi:MAG TPA: dihydroneopterin aldolase [Flavobacteriales bacterium]|nr:dihydroneopterin aldolase [Flavobacteriales bacterium]
MGTVRLEGMEFFAHHGYHSDEITRGNKFVVDLFFDVEMSEASASDELKKALDYEEVYDFIKREMNVRSNLLEHAAQRMLNGLKVQFPEIKAAEITLSKHNPPLKGIVQKVSVTIKS